MPRYEIEIQLILLMPLAAGPILQYFLNTRTYRYTYQIKSEQSRSEGINRSYLFCQALEALKINAPTKTSNVLECQVYTGVVEPGAAAVTSDYFCSTVLTSGTTWVEHRPFAIGHFALWHDGGVLQTLDFDVFGRISKDDFGWCIFITIIYTFRKKPQN